MASHSNTLLKLLARPGGGRAPRGDRPGCLSPRASACGRETLRAPATCAWQRERPESDAAIHGIAVVLRRVGSAIAAPATVVPSPVPYASAGLWKSR